MFKQLCAAATVVLVTAMGVASAGPLIGIGGGLLLAALLVVLPAARTKVEVRFAKLASSEPHATPLLAAVTRESNAPVADLLLARLSGPLTFLSQGQLMALLDGPPWPRYVVLDLSAVAFVDGGGVNELAYLVDFLAIRGGHLVVAGCSDRARESLKRAGIVKRLAGGAIFDNLERALDALTRAQEPPRAAALSRAAGW